MRAWQVMPRVSRVSLKSWLHQAKSLGKSTLVTFTPSAENPVTPDNRIVPKALRGEKENQQHEQAQPQENVDTNQEFSRSTSLCSADLLIKDMARLLAHPGRQYQKTNCDAPLSSKAGRHTPNVYAVEAAPLSSGAGGANKYDSVGTAATKRVMSDLVDPDHYSSKPNTQAHVANADQVERGLATSEPGTSRNVSAANTPRESTNGSEGAGSTAGKRGWAKLFDVEDCFDAGDG